MKFFTVFGAISGYNSALIISPFSNSNFTTGFIFPPEILFLMILYNNKRNNTREIPFSSEGDFPIYLDGLAGAIMIILKPLIIYIQLLSFFVF